MSNRLNPSPLILAFLLFSPAGWAEEVKLSETMMVKLARQEAAATAKADASIAQAKLGEATFSEKFETNAFATANRTDTRQRGIFVFAPATGPVDAYEMGVQKQLSHGLGTSASVFSEQVSLGDDSVERATTTGFKLGITADLWKNFLGGLDDKQREALKSQAEVAALQGEIEKKGFELEVRKLYWSLVANNESINITKQLYENSQRQLKDAQQRYRDSVADDAEIARYRAQVAARKASLTSFEFQRQQLFLQIKSILPGLRNKELSLADYNVQATVQQVMVCTAQIGGSSGVPWDATKYDDIVKGLEAHLAAKDSVADVRNAPDLQLVSELTYTGIGNSYGNSFDELGSEGQPAYAVGLQLTVPIGGKRSAAEVIEKISNRAQFNAQNLDLMARVNAHHEEMAPVISMLQKAVQDQQESADLLAKAIQATERKFDQARVSVDALINDQDALRDTELAQIKTKLAVIHAVLDYLKVFTDTNCALNKV